MNDAIDVREKEFLDKVMELANEMNVDCIVSTDSGVRARLTKIHERSLCKNINDAMVYKIKDEFLYKGPVISTNKKRYDATIEFKEGKMAEPKCFDDLHLKADDICIPYRFQTYTFSQFIRVITKNYSTNCTSLSMTLPFKTVKIVLDVYANDENLDVRISPDCDAFKFDASLSCFLTISISDYKNKDLAKVLITPEISGRILKYKEVTAKLDDYMIEIIKKVDIESTVITDKIYLKRALSHTLCRSIEQYLYGYFKPMVPFNSPDYEVKLKYIYQEYSFRELYDYLAKFNYKASRLQYHYLGDDLIFPYVSWYIYPEDSRTTRKTKSFSLLYENKDLGLRKLLFIEFTILNNDIHHVEIYTPYTSEPSSKADIERDHIRFDIGGISSNINVRSLMQYGDRLIRKSDYAAPAGIAYKEGENSDPMIPREIVNSLLGVLYRDIVTHFDLVNLENE